MKAYVDIDDVLARTIESLIDLLDETHGRRVDVEAVEHFDLEKSFDLGAAEIFAFMERAELLKFGEIGMVVKAAASLGVRKVRLERVYKTVFENESVKRLLRMIPGMNELLLLGKAFDLERDHLRPVGGIAPFLQVRELVRRVNAEGCIELDTNAYSVPWRLIGETVTVIVSADTVVVEYAGEEVARHAELSGSRGRSIERRHLLGGSPPPAEIETPPPTDALLRPLAEYEALVGGGW